MIHTIIRLISIPCEYVQRGNISLCGLVKESGYLDVCDQISAQDIREVLLSHTDYVGVWLGYSADKRGTPSWYFLFNKENKYIVGYYGEQEVIEAIYDDGFLACACFIKHELDHISSRIV